MRKLWTPGRDGRRVRLVRNEAVMGELENVLSEWFDHLDPYEINKCAEVIRAAVELDQHREEIGERG